MTFGKMVSNTVTFDVRLDVYKARKLAGGSVSIARETAMKKCGLSLFFLMKHIPKVIFFLLFMWAGEATAAACSSNATGNWSTPGTWSCNGVPATGDTVTILTGHTITLDVTTSALGSLTVNSGGKLTLTGTGGSDVYLGGNLTNNGTIDFQSSSGTNTIYLGGANITSTFSGTGTWLLDNLDLNGNSPSCTGACKVELSGTPNLQFGNSSLFSGNSVNFTFNALGNSTATVTLNRAGSQTVAATGTTYPNLVLAGSGPNTKSFGTANWQTINVLGSLTINNGVTLSETSRNPNVAVAGSTTNNGTYTAGSGMHTFAGDFTNNGTFTAGTGTVTLTGTNSTLGGSVATTFNSLTINKTAGNNVSIDCATPSPLVNATLALTSGDIVTSGASPACATSCAAQVPIIVAAAGTITGGSSTSYVQGALRKLFSAGAGLSYRAAGLDEFPVGDSTNYTPVEITAGTTSTAGNITACVTPTDHPQVTAPGATTGIDAAKSVNRYWSLTTSTINTTAAPVDATFKFVASDVDAGATTGNFVAENYGTYWRPTTLVAAGATSTEASNIDLTSTVSTNNDIAIGEPLPGFTALPGLYNAFETATPAGAILGKIQTKVAGTGFSVDVVHINATKTGVSPVGIVVELRLLDSSGGGALDVNGCNATWPLIQALPSFTIPASGRGTIPAATVANSYRSVRFQIRSPVGGSYTQIGCSTDLFAMRPASLTITAWDATWATAGTTRTLANTGASGGNVHKAATAASPLPFTLRATPVPATATNYDGSPGTVALFPQCGTLCATVGGLSFTAGSWTAAGSGVRENATANYSEAGSFNLQLEDATYASVDAVDGTPPAALTVPATASVEIGRFVPDHFDVSALITPMFKTFNAADAACATPPSGAKRSFTYIGQPFGYATLPKATILARNAAGATTANYQGAGVGGLWKIGGTSSSSKDCTTNPDICLFTSSWSTASGNSSSATEKYAYTLTPLSTPNWDNAGAATAAATVTPGAGSGTIAISSSNTLAFLRSNTTPQAIFTANISDTVSVTDASEVGSPFIAGNGTITTTTPLVFNGTVPGSGIDFDGGGVSNGKEFRYGRLKLSNAYGSPLLGMHIPIQAQYWNATIPTFVTNSVDNCTTLTSSNIKLATPPAGVSATVGGAFSSGVGSLTLTRPTTPAQVAVDLCVDLGADPGVGTVCSATSAVMPYLQGLWVPGTSYNNDPAARASFGVYKGNNVLIYQRENY